MDKIFIKYVGRTLETWVMENKEFYDGGGINNPYVCQLEFYHMFLQETDFITAKIIEAQILGSTCKDYADVLSAREYAREQINALELTIEENNQKIALGLVE